MKVYILTKTGLVVYLKHGGLETQGNMVERERVCKREVSLSLIKCDYKGRLVTSSLEPT